MPLYCAGLCDAVNIAAGAVEGSGGEVHEVGRRQPEVDDVEPLLHHPAWRTRRPAPGRIGRMSRPIEHPVGCVGSDELGESDTERVRDLASS